jgi:hypothetical protein
MHRLNRTPEKKQSAPLDCFPIRTADSDAVVSRTGMTYIHNAVRFSEYRFYQEYASP